MPHVRTQLRNAVKTRLSTISSIKGAYDMTRHGRDYQSDNFPAALVALTESSSPDPGGLIGERPVTRRYRIDIQIAVEEKAVDAEDTIDAVCVELEKALVVPPDGIGRISNWSYSGTTAIDGQPTESGMLLVETVTYTCELKTLDSAPDINLHS